MRYQNVIFDLDDTLLDFQAGENKGLQQVLTRYDFPDLHQAAALYRKINMSKWVRIEQGEAKEPLLVERFSDLFAHYGKPDDGVAAEKLYRRCLNENYAVMTGALTLLQQLKQAHVNIFAGTNGFDFTQRNRLKHTGFAPYFTDVFVSESVGYEKPSPHFFETILNQYPQMTTDNTVMVGDRLQSDIRGAGAAHLDSIWLNQQQQANTTPYQPTYEVAHLAQIVPLVTDQNADL
jgi:putative hydrolase of the HAD superfamily